VIVDLFCSGFFKASKANKQKKERGKRIFICANGRLYFSG